MSDEPLPDTNGWVPTKRAAENLKAAFENRCAGVERLIQARARFEREFNIHNFDSGPGVEDIVRAELRRLCPNRYAIAAGVINDRAGYSAGDFDVVVFNDLWFPAIKAGATPESRRVHYPIEGVYAVCEVKQTLSLSTLDDAMEKLVKAHRLHRPRTSPHRVTENYNGPPSEVGLSNPLYSAIIGVELDAGCELEDVLDRFLRINQKLKRLEVVRALSVVGYGTFTWGYNDGHEFRPALFMGEDLGLPLSPVFHRIPPASSALYSFVTDLFLHLFHSILAPEDIPAHYGTGTFKPRIAPGAEDLLRPDIE